MSVIQQGSINTTALVVPDLYVQIVPPSVTLLNGVPTNKLGIVGIANWGPVNSPVVFGNMADGARVFGSMQNLKHDLLTAAAAAVMQGANNLCGVRVTDGTDIAAHVDLMDTTAITPLAGATATALHTGTLGNKISMTISLGSAASTHKFTVAMPGGVPEVFDNIAGATAAFWTNLVAAVNQGLSGIRGPSQIIKLAIGAGTAAPALATYTAASGTDGNTTITDVVLVGDDTTMPRKGMYALRNTKTSIAFLAEADDPTHWTDQAAFALSEGIYMVLTGPASQTITEFGVAVGTAGVDTYGCKTLLGDWVYFNDSVNSITRLISPQGFCAGRLANLSPEQSSLNKPLYGIVATQKSAAQQTYSGAELALLAAARGDVITNPSPGGSFFSMRFGHNSSSNAVTNGDNYTRMTNYIASTLDAGMGRFVGRLQTKPERLEAKGTIEFFLSNMEGQEMIGDVNGGPGFQVILDASNNPNSRVALGYQQADVKVVYLSIVEKFIINVEGGQSVQISRQSTQTA